MKRRDFLKRSITAGGLFPVIVRGQALGFAGGKPASLRVTIGCIGVGGRGTYDMRELMHFGAQIVAVCDVKAWERERAARIARIPSASAYRDFRELLDRDDIDAVLIATPDHWHVPIAIEAVKAGKDIYVEKPLGRTIHEGKVLRSVLRASDRVFLHGTEQRAMPAVRKICELVRNGYIGKLHTITVAVPGGRELPDQPPAPVPAGFDYDMWLGPAPWRAYTEKRCTKPWHFFISDYAPSGFICGWGVHHLDMAQWANGTDHTGPIEIEGTAVFPKGGLLDTALRWRIEYRYENGVRLIFTDTSQNPEGVKFEGTEGWIFKAYGKPPKADPPEILKRTPGPGDVRLYEAHNDSANFLMCVESRKETCAPIEVAHRSTTLGYLGDIACRLKRKLYWDPVLEKFKNDQEADRMLHRPMRDPWDVDKMAAPFLRGVKRA